MGLPHERGDILLGQLNLTNGDDGCIQGLLELLKIPYTGPSLLASALGMDKYLQQKILKEAGLDVPRGIVIREEEWGWANREKSGPL